MKYQIVFNAPHHPVWAIMLACFFIFVTPWATYQVIYLVGAGIRRFRRQRAMWRTLNIISQGSFIRERPRV